MIILFLITHRLCCRTPQDIMPGRQLLVWISEKFSFVKWIFRTGLTAVFAVKLPNMPDRIG
jgi:hypothetical protein